MAQITWRNINAPAAAVSSGNAGAGANLLERGFSRIEQGLGQLVDNRQDRLQREYQTQYDANTRAAMAEINGIQDLVGLSEARQGGLNIDAFKQRFGDAFDYDQVDKYLQGSEQRLRDQLTKTQQFDTQQQEYRDKPILDRLLGEVNALQSDGGPQAIAANRDKLIQQIRNSGVSTSAQNKALAALDQRAATLDDRFYGDQTQQRDYGRTVALDKGRKLMNEFLTTGVNQAEGRTGLEAQLVADEVPADIKQQLIAEYDNALVQREKLTPEQERAYKTKVNEETIERDYNVAQINSALEEEKARYPISEVPAFQIVTNGQGRSPGAVKAAVADRLNSDGIWHIDGKTSSSKDEVYQHLDRALLGAVASLNGNSLQATNKDLTSQALTGLGALPFAGVLADAKLQTDKGAVDRTSTEELTKQAEANGPFKVKDIPPELLYEAVERVGTPDGYLDTTLVQKELVNVIREFEIDKENRVKRKEAEEKANKAVYDYNKVAFSGSNDLINEYRLRKQITTGNK